jgi:predicted ArsR family transcriptional regulator
MARTRNPLLATTRARVLEALRRPQTVEQLATALGLTGNAVRSHLADLVRDGFVHPGPLRRTARRPSRTYVLAPSMLPLICQGYVPFVASLMAVLSTRMPKASLDDALRRTGRAMAGRRRAGSLKARVEAAAALLDDIGGATQVTVRRNGATTYVIEGAACPLEAAVRAYPGVCGAVEELVSAMTGSTAREHCRRDAVPPQCVVEVKG